MKGTVDIAKAVAKKLNVTSKTARGIINIVFTEIGQSLADGEDVTIKDFGIFRVKPTAAREIKSPRTGELVPIEASRRLVFKVGATLKDSVREGTSYVMNAPKTTEDEEE